MSAQVYSFPDQTGKEPFLEWKSIDLSSKLSFTCGGNVNYYKSVHHPVPTRQNREHPGKFQNKSVSSLFNLVPRNILFLAKWKGRGRPFLKGARTGETLRLPPRALGCHKRWKFFSFVKLEIILPLLYFLWDPLTNKHYRTWSSMINLWIDSRTCKK